MMFHRRYQVLLPLRATGRLSAGEAAMLERHLRSCASCRKELDEIRHLQAIMASVADDGAASPSLNSTRSRVARDIREGRHLRPPLRRDRFRRTQAFPPVLMYAGAGLALLAVGFFGGRYLAVRGGAGEWQAANAPEIRVTQVIADRSGKGMIDIAYEQIQKQQIRGTIDDPAVQHVLARALVNGDNAGVRLRALEAMASTERPAPEREVKAALLLALTSDANDGVRRQALDALVRLRPDMQVRDALLQVLLHDSNPGLRIAAINALDSLRTNVLMKDETTRSSLRRLVAGDDNIYVQVKARSLLEEHVQ
jgi:hypothetical protein